MAVLIEIDRVLIWAGLMRQDEEFSGMLKADLRAAVDATDDWINTNQASYNAALPLPSRTSLTARQKNMVFGAVAGRKFKVS